MSIKAIIDPHHHLWDLEKHSYPWLRQTGEPFVPMAGSLKSIMKSYSLADYREETKRWNIVKDVHMDALSADVVTETRWLQQMNEETGFPTAIVAHTDLEADNVDDILATHAQSKAVRGIRQILNWHADPKYRFIERNDLMTDAKWLHGFGLLRKYGFTFDLQIYPHQMADAAKVASAHPQTTIVLNHTGMALERDDAGLQSWREGMKALAANANVMVKISGLGLVDPNWTLASIRPFVMQTLETFGIDRCMFASNFPVDRMYASFDRTYEAFFELVKDLPDAARQKLFHDNALHVYRL